METLTLTIFMMLQTTPEWLALEPESRFQFLEETVQPILVKHPEVSLRFYDSEFYNSRITDVAIWETKELKTYNALVEDLRETPFWDKYFTIVEIIPSVENAYAEHYDQDPVQE